MFTFIHDTRRARKEHRCDDCHRVIRKGETYIRGVGLGDGTAWTWKECAHCRAILDLYVTYWDYTYNEDDFQDWEPQTVTELRAKVNYNRKWERADGSLVEVPS